MIVLDTNVVSELMRPAPDARVVEWVDSHPGHVLHLTAITVAELLYGIARLPDGRRKTVLAGLVEAMLEEDFHGQVVAFDDVAAAHYADIVAERERAGTPIAAADAQIAAISRSHGALLATRNLRDFEGTQVATVDPWTDVEQVGTGARAT